MLMQFSSHILNWRINVRSLKEDCKGSILVANLESNVWILYVTHDVGFYTDFCGIFKIQIMYK